MENFQEVPDPCDHGWVMVENILEPLWCAGGVIPDELVDLLAGYSDSDDENEEIDFNLDENEESDIEENP